MASKECCGNCKYFVRHSKPGARFGNCRALPPVPMVVQYISGIMKDSLGAPTSVMNANIDGFFPVTNDETWCGSYIEGPVADVVPFAKRALPTETKTASGLILLNGGSDDAPDIA